MRPSLVATLISLAAHSATLFALLLSAYIQRRWNRNLFETLLRRTIISASKASSKRSQTSLIVGKEGTACQSRSIGTSPATAMVAGGRHLTRDDSATHDH
jgi:hypothetical protein